MVQVPFQWCPYNPLHFLVRTMRVFVTTRYRSFRCVIAAHYLQCLLMRPRCRNKRPPHRHARPASSFAADFVRLIVLVCKKPQDTHCPKTNSVGPSSLRSSASETRRGNALLFPQTQSGRVTCCAQRSSSPLAHESRPNHTVRRHQASVTKNIQPKEA